MTSQAYLLTSIPRIKYLFLFKLFRQKELYILDTSLIDFVDQRPKIECFIKWLKRWGYKSKISVIKPLEYEEERWHSNKEALMSLLQQFSKMIEGDTESQFLGNYLASRSQVNTGTHFYEQKVINDFATKGIKLITLTRSKDKATSFLNKITSSLSPLLLFPVLLALFLKYTIQNIALHASFIQKSYGGICVDFASYHVYKSDGSVDTTGGSDAYLVNESESFSIKNHVFLAFGWPNNKRFTLKLKNKLENDGARVIGDQAGKNSIFWVDLLYCVSKNVKLWLALSIKEPGPCEGWTLNLRWLHLKYQYDRFRTQIVFNNLIPSVYLSRMDYNHLHHAIASVCKAKGINYVGICHSPSGGIEHVPSMSIISFEHYFVYSDFIVENLYPTWINNYTKLHSIGVWRTDHILKCLTSKTYQKQKEAIKRKLQKYFVVALHLPVPNSYLFSEDDVKRWMECFKEILNKNDNLYFVLFPRRLESSPQYFHDLIDTLKNTGRAELAIELEPKWKYSYPWPTVCNLVLGCSFSDAVLEAWAVKTPAASYSDIGEGRAALEKFDKLLRVYNYKDLDTLFKLTSKGKWPPSGLGDNLRKVVTGTADGRSIERMQNLIRTLL